MPRKRWGELTGAEKLQYYELHGYKRTPKDHERVRLTREERDDLTRAADSARQQAYSEKHGSYEQRLRRKGYEYIRLKVPQELVQGFNDLAKWFCDKKARD